MSLNSFESDGSSTGVPLPAISGDVSWTMERAGLLLSRVQHGVSAQELAAAHAAGMNAVVDRLVTPQEESAEFHSADRLLRERAINTGDIGNLQAWWLHRSSASSNPLVEKLTLMWHNHFATSYQKVQSVDAMLAQNDLLRTHATGSFSELLTAMARDVAMLIWLDGNSNRKRHPNENFARELFELFALGVGNYSESDIQEAARAFTGWHVRNNEYWFNSLQHDDGTKTVFGKTGSFNGEDILRLSLEHPACPRFVAFKLLRELVTSNPSPEQIGLLAERITAHSYHLQPVLSELFRSELFWNTATANPLIKSPVQYVLGSARSLCRTTNLQQIAAVCADLGQDLFQPPTVKGWDGGRTWLNSTTWLARVNFATRLSSGDQYGQLALDGVFPLEMVRASSATTDIGHSEWAATGVAALFGGRVPESVSAAIKKFLQTTSGTVSQRQRGLVALLLAMPEYHVV